MTSLPRETAWVGVPPIKCQGIKTKLVPFILGNIQWDDHGSGRWIEPFMGFGVVALNLAPQRALLVDTNVHIINLYAAIQRGEVLSSLVREHLKIEGRKLATRGADYFYEVRDRFNQQGDVLDFLFLNRSCFNGVMRFNRRGQFNVPFSHKPERFAQSYITKISNQVSWVAKQMQGKDWEFKVSSLAGRLGRRQRIRLHLPRSTLHWTTHGLLQLMERSRSHATRGSDPPPALRLRAVNVV